MRIDSEIGTPDLPRLSANQLTVLRVLAGEFVAREMEVELRYEHVPLDVVVACIDALFRDLPRVKAAAARLKEAIAPRRGPN